MPHFQRDSILQDLFVLVPCPLCGGSEFEVRKQSEYPPDITVEQLKEIFRASSDTHLLDQLVQCRQCDLVYVNPQIDEKLLIEGYESTVDPKFIAQNPERIRTFSRMLRSLARSMGMPNGGSGKKILDVGCAGGAFLVAARDFGFDAYGVEPSRWLADSGRTQYGLNIRQGILEPGLFPPAHFDVVSLWDVIEHLSAPKLILKTIHEILKPGGTLLVNFPDYGSIVARMMGNRWPFLLNVHILYYTRQTITKQLEMAGFEVKKIQPHWQSLRAGYVLERAEPYVGLAKYARKIVEGIGLGNVPVTYQLGQTLVVARKAAQK